MAEFIYQMYQARKAHGDKVILDDVTLSFYPGAKIGVVGPNGMGKSTLLKIMAGIEEVSNGDARLTPGYTVGILQQEPPLDDDKTVIENVRMAFGDMIAKVDRFNKIGEEMCDPDCDMDALMAEMGKLQDEIDTADGWDIDSKLGQAMDALQLPDSDMPVNVLSGGERPLQQTILRMKDVEEYETEEIAEITGCSSEAIRSNLSRARKKVRDIYLQTIQQRKRRNEA